MGEKLRWDMVLPNGEPLRWDMGPAFTWDGEVPDNLNPPTPIHMPQNLISATLAQTLATEIIADVAALRTKQNAFLLALSAEAKKDLMKMGSGNLALEGHIRSAATENPGELASNFPLAAWDEDRAFAATYRPVVAALQKLASDAEDTLFAADSDSWTVAMEAYGDIKKDGVGPAIDQARALIRQHRRGNSPAAPSNP